MVQTVWVRLEESMGGAERVRGVRIKEHDDSAGAG
jgi:hypothetical protein